MKKVLFVYPHNFLERNMGTNIRVFQVAAELHAKGYEIDLFAFSSFCSSFDDFESANQDGLINKLFLYDFRKIIAYRKWQKKKFLLSNLLTKRNFDDELDDWTTPEMIKQFNQVVSEGQYDSIVMFYVYTAELLSGLKGENIRKIYFMEDMLSANCYLVDRTRDLGLLMDSELRRISYFDQIVCISWDEKTFIEKLISGKEFFFLPHIVRKQDRNRDIFFSGKRLPRVLFIGFDNPYNIEGMKWFLQQVYPLLNLNMEIQVVGKVTRHLEEWKRQNINMVEYAPDLDILYRSVDIVICPLQNGTGMKVKVIEAMSYGIPVVCTSRGVDGFPDKTMNGCLVEDKPQAFATAINRLASDEGFYKSCQAQVEHYFAEVLEWDKNRFVLTSLFGDAE